MYSDPQAKDKKWVSHEGGNVTQKIKQCIDDQLVGVSPEVWQEMPPTVGYDSEMTLYLTLEVDVLPAL